MKILFHAGNIHFQGFGGKNFVIPDKSEGDMVLLTLQAVVAAQQSVQRTELCPSDMHETLNKNTAFRFCGYCGQPLSR